jgi:hypothetical protein
MTSPSSLPSGYSDPAYADALGHIGRPRRLTRSGGSILVRDIETTGYTDAVGPYPLFACSDWHCLVDDLNALGDELLSLAVVVDPFGDWTVGQLEEAFPDRCTPFKEHFIVDLSRSPTQTASRHHRRDAARALRRSSVSRVEDLAGFLDEWDELYAGLVRRQGVEGPAGFPRASFERQLSVRGLTAFRAERAGVLVGASLWLVDGPVAYYHLAAQTSQGYAHGASYGLMATALEHFAERGLEWATLGAAAGAGNRDAADGLARFKAGWASGTRTAFLGGRILNEARYAELTATRGASPAYFPAYRSGRR